MLARKAPIYACSLAAAGSSTALLVGLIVWGRPVGPTTAYLGAVGSLLGAQALLPHQTARSSPLWAVRGYAILTLVCSTLLLLVSLSGGRQTVYWWSICWWIPAAVLAANLGWPDVATRRVPWLLLQPGGVASPRANGYTLQLELAPRQQAHLHDDGPDESEGAGLLGSSSNSSHKPAAERSPGGPRSSSPSKDSRTSGSGLSLIRNQALAGCLIGLSLVLAAVLSSCLAFQAVAVTTDAWAYPPLGRLVVVPREELMPGAPGRDVVLHLHCQGAPYTPQRATFVLEAGLSSSSSSLEGLAAAIAAGNRRVCIYDRLGYGWSDPVKRDYNLLEAPELLVSLLKAAGENGPFILVGHSMGGGLVQVLAAKNSDLVSGVALLDATSAFNGTLSSPEARAAAAKGQSGMSLWRGLAPLGWHRAIRLPGTAGYRWGSAMRAAWGRTDIFTTSRLEWECITCADQQLTALADAAPQLGEVTWPGLEGSKPLLVVVANSTVQLPAACELQPYVNGWPASKLQQSNCTQQLLYSRSGPSDNSVGRGNPWIRQALMYNSTLSKNSKLLVCPDVPGRPCEHDFPWTHTDWLAAVLLARFAGT